MDNLLLRQSLARRALWLAELRWAAIAALVIATTVASRWMGVGLARASLYTLAGVVAGYNTLLHGTLALWRARVGEQAMGGVRHVVSLQISLDLFILTGILHWSGGVENPVAIFFVFHMILASILCSRLESYLQASLAVFLYAALAGFECSGRLPHHALSGFAATDLYAQPTYVQSVVFVLSVTLYLIVYMTTSMAAQIRAQQMDLAAANAQLHEKDRIKNEYVLRVTHDMKGHLAAIQSLIQVVDDHTVGPLNPRQQDLIGRAHRRTIQCVAFVQALLKLTRMKLAGTLAESEVHLRELVDGAVALIVDTAADKGVTLDVENDLGTTSLRGLPLMLEEAFSNVLLNAVKYTPSGGRVRVWAGRAGTDAVVRVVDTGLGIPEGDLERIFDEFFRARNARRTERDGTGLGLSFAKKVLERHRGGITAANNPEGGSTFEIRLPLPDRNPSTEGGPSCDDANS